MGYGKEIEEILKSGFVLKGTNSDNGSSKYFFYREGSKEIDVSFENILLEISITINPDLEILKEIEGF